LFVGTGTGTASSGTIALVSHSIVGSHDGQRTILAVVIPSTTTITHIYERFTTTDGGFTLVGAYGSLGKELRLYSKICGPAEAHQYEIHFTPASPGGVDTVIVWLTDFAVVGNAIRTYGFVGSPSGTSLTLPSITAVNGDDIFTLVWNNPLTAAGQLRPQAPLRTTGNALVSAFPQFYMEESTEVWQSSAPTGTRSYAVASGNHEGSIGVIMLVGGIEPAAVGGWGVGAVRMGN
jgi:hypothetical protein